jgi:hypothetical protein
MLVRTHSRERCKGTTAEFDAYVFLISFDLYKVQGRFFARHFFSFGLSEIPAPMQE